MLPSQSAGFAVVEHPTSCWENPSWKKSIRSARVPIAVGVTVDVTSFSATARDEDDVIGE